MVNLPIGADPRKASGIRAAAHIDLEPARLLVVFGLDRGGHLALSTDQCFDDAGRPTGCRHPRREPLERLPDGVHSKDVIQAHRRGEEHRTIRRLVLLWSGLYAAVVPATLFRLAEALSQRI